MTSDADSAKLKREMDFLVRSMTPERPWLKAAWSLVLFGLTREWFFVGLALGSVVLYGGESAIREWFKARRRRLDRLNATAAADKPNLDWRERKAEREADS